MEITKEQFEKAIRFCQEIDKRENAFSKALQEFQGQDDFITGFCSNTAVRILDWLADVMGDKYRNIISWWYYECPDQGRCKDDDDCTIWSKDEKQKWVLRTPSDIYDYLVEINQ